jgi:putative endonuclease
LSLVTRLLGQRGEDLAAVHFVRLGARVLARNFRCPHGELDLVVEHEGDLVGVEVKTRRAGQPASPEEAVGYLKLVRLERALTQFAQEANLEERAWRIDVLAVEVGQDGTVRRVDHIRDAYQG